MASSTQATRAFARGAYRLGSARLATRFPGGGADSAAAQAYAAHHFVPGGQSLPALGVRFAGALMNYHAAKGREEEQARLITQNLEDSKHINENSRSALENPNEGLIEYQEPGGQSVMVTPYQHAQLTHGSQPKAAKTVPLEPWMADALRLPRSADNRYDLDEAGKAMSLYGHNLTEEHFTANHRLALGRFFNTMIDKFAGDRAAQDFEQNGRQQLLDLGNKAKGGDAKAMKMLGISDTPDAYTQGTRAYKGSGGLTGWQRLVDDRVASVTKDWQAQSLRQARDYYAADRQKLMDFVNGYGTGGELDRGSTDMRAPQSDETPGGGGISAQGQALIKAFGDKIDAATRGGSQQGFAGPPIPEEPEAPPPPAPTQMPSVSSIGGSARP